MKIPTDAQWEDLADRVQSKAEIGSVVSTPSNVAYVGTNNIVDGAVTTGKIANNTITSNKIDFSTITGAQLGSLLSTASIGTNVAMVINTTYNVTFNGFIAFQTFFTSTNGYVRYRILDENDNTVFEYQQNSGPVYSYRHYSPYFPVKSGWKYTGESSDTQYVNSLSMIPVTVS